MASEKKRSSSSGRRTEKRAAAAGGAAAHYAVCVRNDDYAASLELRKLYPVIRDQFADEHGMIRVVDESGEDYLYPADYFVTVELPAALENTLHQIA